VSQDESHGDDRDQGPGSDDAPASDGAASRASDSPSLVCEVCGGAMFERHCKIVCPRCGYQRDCTDP
jgi:rubrerythrin